MARVTVSSDWNFEISKNSFVSTFPTEEIARFQALDEAIFFLVSEQNKYIPPDIEGPEREGRWVKQPFKSAPPAADRPE